LSAIVLFRIASMHLAGFSDLRIGLLQGLEFLFRGTLNLFAQVPHAVGMIFESHFPVCLPHFIIAGIGTDLQHFVVVAFVFSVEHCRYGTEVGGADVEVAADALQQLHFVWVDLSVGPGNTEEEMQELEAGRMRHIGLYLQGDLPQRVILFEEFPQDENLLAGFFLSELLHQKCFYIVEFAAQHFSIGFHHPGSQDQQAEGKISFACACLLGLIGIFARLHCIKHRPEDESQNAAYGAAKSPTEATAQPFTECHIARVLL